MEKLDLHKVYKNFYQRWYREKDSEDLTRIKELIRELIGNLYHHKFYKTITETVMIKSIEIAKQVESLENELRRFNVSFSKNLAKALEENNYEINIPPHKISRWIEKENYYGNMYVLISKYRPNQSKLGVTNLDIHERIEKYTYRHGYVVELYYLEKDILQPYMHEQRISKKYLELRHSGNADGDSSEWYFLKPEVLKKELTLIKKQTNL